MLSSVNETASVSEDKVVAVDAVTVSKLPSATLTAKPADQPTSTDDAKQMEQAWHAQRKNQYLSRLRFCVHADFYA